MRANKRIVKTAQPCEHNTYRGCPLTRNRTAWCFQLCAPDDGGKGRCGRVAPHDLKGNTQLSIKEFNENHLGYAERE